MMTKAERTKDRHRAHRMVRLPEELYVALQKLARQHKQPVHALIRESLIYMARQNGVLPDPLSPDNGG